MTHSNIRQPSACALAQTAAPATQASAHAQLVSALLQVGYSGAPSELAQAILEPYGRPSRRFHTADHVVAALAALDKLLGTRPCSELDRALAVLAIAYHDVVYVPGAEDNELKSGERMLLDLQGRVPARVMEGIRTAVQTIRATRAHVLAIHTPYWCSAVIDADLSVLAAAPTVYDTYAELVRAEYVWTSERDWIAARLHFLERMQARHSIYLTQAGQAWWDRSAQANMERERQLLLSRRHASITIGVGARAVGG